MPKRRSTLRIVVQISNDQPWRYTRSVVVTPQVAIQVGLTSCHINLGDLDRQLRAKFAQDGFVARTLNSNGKDHHTHSPKSASSHAFSGAVSGSTASPTGTPPSRRRRICSSCAASSAVVPS